MVQISIVEKYKNIQPTEVQVVDKKLGLHQKFLPKKGIFRKAINNIIQKPRRLRKAKAQIISGEKKEALKKICDRGQNPYESFAFNHNFGLNYNLE